MNELDELWADCLPVQCPYCHVPAGTKCVYPKSKVSKRAPCGERIRAVGQAAS